MNSDELNRCDELKIFPVPSGLGKLFRKGAATLHTGWFGNFVRYSNDVWVVQKSMLLLSAYFVFGRHKSD